jgi:hypothetical protein
MNTLIEHEHPGRSFLRSTGVLGIALALTTGVLVGLSSLVDIWA